MEISSHDRVSVKYIQENHRQRYQAKYVCHNRTSPGKLLTASPSRGASRGHPEARQPALVQLAAATPSWDEFKTGSEKPVREGQEADPR
eukprot:scaffold118905_cov30-Phaeocystis_antarctica.AAC.1